MQDKNAIIEELLGSFDSVLRVQLSERCPVEYAPLLKLPIDERSPMPSSMLKITNWSQ